MSTIHVDPNTMDKILETQAVHHHTKSLFKRDPEDDYRLFLKQPKNKHNLKALSVFTRQKRKVGQSARQRFFVLVFFFGFFTDHKCPL